MAGEHVDGEVGSVTNDPRWGDDAASAGLPVDVFVSYAHKDRYWKDWLVDGPWSAGPFKVRFWTDDQIRPSDDWHKRIKTSLESAKIVVLLVSQSFLNSAFIQK
jgi:hypothetical protein